MSDFIVQNADTGSLVSNYGSKGWCRDVAGILNRQYQTDCYRVVPYAPEPLRHETGSDA